MKKELTFILKESFEVRKIATFVQEAGNFKSEIWVKYNDIRVNAKSFVGTMALACAAGDAVTIIAEGEDAEAALSKLSEFFIY